MDARGAILVSSVLAGVVCCATAAAWGASFGGMLRPVAGFLLVEGILSAALLAVLGVWQHSARGDERVTPLALLVVAGATLLVVNGFGWLVSLAPGEADTVLLNVAGIATSGALVGSVLWHRPTGRLFLQDAWTTPQEPLVLWIAVFAVVVVLLFGAAGTSFAGVVREHPGVPLPTRDQYEAMTIAIVVTAFAAGLAVQAAAGRARRRSGIRLGAGVILALGAAAAAIAAGPVLRGDRNQAHAREHRTRVMCWAAAPTPVEPGQAGVPRDPRAEAAERVVHRCLERASPSPPGSARFWLAYSLACLGAASAGTALGAWVPRRPERDVPPGPPVRDPASRSGYRALPDG